MSIKHNIIVGLIVVLIAACGNDTPEFYPKPRGFMRLDFPDRTYSNYEGDCSFSFEIPEYFEVQSKGEGCNKDILIARFNASIYLTYIPVDTNLNMNIEYARKLAYDHSIKADEIQEAVVNNDKNKSYGMKYNIVGNAASPYQFYLTDSSNHFLRGALYFNARPNYDSLRPFLEYILVDVDHMIETVKWSAESDTSSLIK